MDVKKTSLYTPAEVGHYYDEWTQRYLDVAGDILQGYRASDRDELLRYTMQAGGFGAGEKILDAGCGVAGPAVFFAQTLPLTIEGLTVSGVQKILADKKIRAAGLSEKINITEGDYHELDRIYQAGYFDRIIFLESLGHAADPARVIRAAYTVVKDHGFIYIKDLFSKESTDECFAEKIRQFVSNMNQHYKYNVLDLASTITSLRSVGA